MSVNTTEVDFSSLAEHLAVILVETSHPANIGSVARAMKTMGFTKLRLVAPLDFPSVRAQWLAAGAEDLLEQAVVYPNFTAAVADCQFIVGTSARLRGLPWPHVPPIDAAGALLNHAAKAVQCAIVFGREASGLSNDELQGCHLHTLIPGNPAYSVLNIAQAVQVLCYELHTQWLLTIKAYRGSSVAADKAKSVRAFLEYPSMPWEEELATSEEMTGLFEHLQISLTKVGFIADYNHGKIWPRLHRMYQKQRLDKKEAALLRGLCSHLDNLTADRLD